MACGSESLEKILDLGNQPLANEYLENPRQRDLFPLFLNVCTNCTHMQLGIEVSPKRMFQDYYYVAGLSKQFEYFLIKFTEKKLLHSKTSKKIIEIGSNDGSLLKIMQKNGLDCIGVDPAINITNEANKSDLLTIPTFFGKKLTNFLAKNFDTALAFNVFAHNAAPLEMLENIKNITEKEAKIFLLTSQANMLIGYQFDTVYHEHMSYFNIRSMKALLNRANLYLEDVEIETIHGYSYLFSINKTYVGKSEITREVFEIGKGMYEIENYRSFQSKANLIASQFIKNIQDYKLLGYKIAIYGAAAKGSTFFNFVQFTPDYIFDDTPNKVNRYSPIGNLKVKSSIESVSIKEKILFIFPAWNIKDELKSKIKYLRPNHNDLALCYFPEFEIEDIL